MRQFFRSLICVAAMMCLAAIASASPLVWTLNGVVFDDGGTASGSFTFDADAGIPCNTPASPCGAFSNVNIVTTTGASLVGTTYGFICGQDVPACSGTSPDSTAALFLTSNAANQAGNRAIAFFFTAVGAFPPAGLTNAGGTIDLSNGPVGVAFESFCSDGPCSSPAGAARATVAGTVSAVTAAPEPMSSAMILLGLAMMTKLRRRTSTPR